ncbi:MAG: hypothetical protein AABW51_00025 [Nanoarchaeota archaeon]
MDLGSSLDHREDIPDDVTLNSVNSRNFDWKEKQKEVSNQFKQTFGYYILSGKNTYGDKITNFSPQEIKDLWTIFKPT